MAKQTKVWFAHKNKYGYVNLNKKTKPLLHKCDVVSGIHYCYLQSIEEALHKYVKKTIAYGEIDERDYQWK